MSTEEKLDQLLAGINQLTKVIEESKNTDTARYQAADAGIVEEAKKATATAEQMQADKDKADKARNAEIAEAVKAEMSKIRTPGKAEQIGQEREDVAIGRLLGNPSDDRTEPHAAMKASFRDYQAGEFLSKLVTIEYAKHENDFAAITRAKAELSAFSDWAAQPEGKATLGATGATGGYVLPNNLVDTLVKPNVQQAVYQNLVTVRSGVNVRGVDMPYRTGAPARLAFIDWGATKTNTDEAYGSYTALLGTLAAVYDIGKQYARFSAGSAEQDVMDELGKAAILGENYYILAGAGTGSSGVGDPTVGVYTALVAAGLGGAFTTAFAGASNSTVAGSAAAGLMSAFGSMAARSTQPTAVVTDAITYWQILSQGSDNAGFWQSEVFGAGFTLGTGGDDLRWRGIPIRYDSNFNTNTSTTKRAIAGNWPAAKLFRGMEFRIDTTDVAGTRWDQNLIGFRGEEEIGFNARPAMFTGNFQLITGLIP